MIKNLVVTKNKVRLSLLICAITALSACVGFTQKEEQAHLTQKPTPKNIILMVSDGIGFNGWLATDYYQGLAGKQSYQISRPDGTQPLVFGLAHGALNLIDENGNILPRGSDASDAHGAVEQLYDPNTRWDKFENAMFNDFDPVSMSYTSYTDSAAAGTALLSGRKTSVGRINVDWSGTVNYTTIADYADKLGKATGAVASVMISHATPASVVARNVSRNNYEDIFSNMVNSHLDVIMGAGHPLYDNNGKFAEESEQDFKYIGGTQTYADLTSEAGLNGFTFIDSKSDFERLAQGKTKPQKVIGLARVGSTLQASRSELASDDTPSGMSFVESVPDLATMSLGALSVLNQDQDGFFVMIEGGAVDWMGHANNMPRFIEEQIDFNKAVNAVIDWVETNSSWDETLLIITSDHECGGIWGEGTWTNSAGGPVASERTPETLEEARFDPEKDTFNDFLIVQDNGDGVIPGFQFSSRNHTNELVPLFAIGVGSERFNEYTRTDKKAAQLWGDAFNWNGHFVDNTNVFDVMLSVLQDR